MYGIIYHTNHPIVNDDLKPVKSNSYIRLESIRSRMIENPLIGDENIKTILRSRDESEYKRIDFSEKN